MEGNYERLAASSLVSGVPILVTAALRLLGRHGLCARAAPFFGKFSASYRAFRSDVGGLVKDIAADRRGLIWLSLITLVGITIRIWFLDQPMRSDEANTYLDFVLPGSEQLFDYSLPNNHVAHTLLVSLSTSVFGAEPWAIRLPAFLAGVLLMPMAYLCARTVCNWSSGLVAAGLVAGSPFLVLYSTNARGYSGIALLTVALVPVCLYLVRKESVFAGFLFALLSAIGLFTIPVMLFPIAMLVVWSLLLAYQAGGWPKTLRVFRAVAWILLLCAMITVVLYTPVLITSGMRSVVANRYVQARDLGDIVARWPRMAWETWMRYQRDIPGLCKACFVVCMLVGALYLWKANRPAFLLFPAALLGVAVVLLALRVNPFQRTWIFLLPLSFCLADAGITATLGLFAHRTRVMATGALSLLFAVGISYHLAATDAVAQYSDTGTTPDAEAIALFLKPRLKEGDWVIIRRKSPLNYYFDRLGMSPGAIYTGGGGDVYLIVPLPRGTFQKIAERYDLHLDENDFVVQEFPSALLYLPREPDD